jgi:hypothetical protein
LEKETHRLTAFGNALEQLRHICGLSHLGQAGVKDAFAHDGLKSLKRNKYRQEELLYWLSDCRFVSDAGSSGA